MIPLTLTDLPSPREVLTSAVERLGRATAPVHGLFALPTLVLGAAYPTVAAFSDPFGWALALWGTFLYWWAGILYVRQTREVTSRSRANAPGASDTLGVQRRSMDD